MKKRASDLVTCAGVMFAMGAAPATWAQGVLIGPTTRNGSFEDGVVAPWNAAFTLVQDATFASDGMWYASIQSALVQPVLSVQNLLPNPNDGLRFLLSFDARIGVPGLDVVTSYMSARTPQGDPISASVTPVAAPPLSTAAWQNYQYELQMPAAWNNSGVTFGIAFSNGQPLGGITHTAFLDNVVLQQIPEPTAVALILLGGGALLWRRRAFQ